MFLKFLRTKTLQLVAATVEAARANSKHIVLDSVDSIIKVVDENGNKKALEPNSGYNGETVTYRFDFDFDGSAGNGAIGNINLMAIPTGMVVSYAKWLKTGDGLSHEGETASSLKLNLATDGDVTAVVEDDDATIGINDVGIQVPAITYRKSSASQQLRVVIGGAAVSGNCALFIQIDNANYISANNPVEEEA